MSEIVNLRQARKRAKRKAEEAVAAANRAKHGRGKAERVATAAEAAMIATIVDGARRDAPADPPPDAAYDPNAANGL